MLARTVVEEFIDCEFEGGGWEIPEGISKDELVEAFCQFTEDDCYEWLEDNFKSFFNHGNPDWDWIRDRIKTHEQR